MSFTSRTSVVMGLIISSLLAGTSMASPEPAAPIKISWARSLEREASSHFELVCVTGGNSCQATLKKGTQTTPCALERGVVDGLFERNLGALRPLLAKLTQDSPSITAEEKAERSFHSTATLTLEWETNKFHLLTPTSSTLKPPERERRLKVTNALFDLEGDLLVQCKLWP